MKAKSKKPPSVKALQTIHLVVFVLTLFTIFSLHFYPQNFLDTLRLPLYLKSIDPFLGYSWPSSLYIYQVVLLFFIFLILIDGLGLFFYQSRFWRFVSDVSSFLGFLLMVPVTFFFIFTLVVAKNLTPDNVITATIYFAFSSFLFLLDLVTWYVDEQSFLKIGKKSKSL